MKAYLLPLLLSSCLDVGDVFSYHMARARTSNVVKDTKVRLEVVGDTDEATVFKLSTFVQPIIGEADERDSEVSIEKSLTSLENLQALREGKVLESESARVQHEGTTPEGCDRLLVDKLPDTENTKDMVVHLTLCGVDEGKAEVPSFDVETTAQGMRIHLGYDKDALVENPPVLRPEGFVVAAPHLP
jgi:hypothetical protein